jgi:hypothetical protein
MENQKKFQGKIGGLAGSFCAQSIYKAFRRMAGVQPLAHLSAPFPG